LTEAYPALAKQLLHSCKDDCDVSPDVLDGLGSERARWSGLRGQRILIEFPFGEQCQLRIEPLFFFERLVEQDLIFP
jgi:hypothetical protein